MDQNAVIMVVVQLAILIFSVILHEIAHGYVAEYLGDPTARNAGRLTLNPISHLDPIGSFILPLSMWYLTSGQFVFGWAKPVPYNPQNLRDPIGGGAKIAAAGPLTNLGIAVIFGILARLIPLADTVKGGIVLSTLSGQVSFSYSPLGGIYFIFLHIILVNILLAIFNLVPIPPLDGSKVFFALLPKSETGFRIMQTLERYGMVLVLLFVFFGFDLILPIISWIFALIVGG